MDARDKITALLKASEDDAAAADAELAELTGDTPMAKADDGSLDDDFNELDEAVDASDTEEAAAAGEDDEEAVDDAVDVDVNVDTDDEDDEEDEEDEDEPFAKADDLTPVDATDLIAGVLEQLTSLSAKVDALTTRQTVLAKAARAQLQGQSVLAKAYGAVLDTPAKPKAAARVPSKPAPKAESAADADAIMAKAIDAIPQGTVTSQDVSVFRGYVQDFGMEAALHLMPQFKTFAG